MEKCLVTKLKGIVNNDSLLKIKEMPISAVTVNVPDGQQNPYILKFIVAWDTSLRIAGEGYFTDSTFTENKGKEVALLGSESFGQNVTVSKNGDFKVIVADKYAIRSLETYGSDYPSKFSFNIEDFKYCKDINIISLDKVTVVGDVSALANLTSLTKFKLTEINNNVTGDIYSFAACTLLTELSVPSHFISGDIASLANLDKLIYLTCKYTKVSGDLAKLPKSVRYASFYEDSKPFSWSSRDSSYSIVALEGNPNLGSDVDKMLTDQAQCQAGAPDQQPWNTAITAMGTRTSASDAAVTTLQQKGYTVSITPA